MKIILHSMLLAAVATGSALADIIRVSPTCEEGTPGAITMVLEGRQNKNAVYVAESVIISDADVKSAFAYFDTNGYGVNIQLTPNGAKRFDEAAAGLQNKQIAIIVNGKLVSAPVLRSSHFGGQMQIAGNFTEAEAKTLAASLHNK